MIRIHFDINLIKTLYSEGLSCPKIASRLGCSTSTVERRLKEVNYVMRDRSDSQLGIMRNKPYIRRSYDGSGNLENRQLKRALEDSQMIFYVNEN